ncbi:MAG: helix-turn-helix domain-containing protein [Bacillota bacterium]|nr:helix-turn-helix domain-containing protein [Bacillota bacterium]
MDNKIKEIIKKLNKEGITTTEIINNSGVGRTQFYAVLNGESIPKLTTAIAICKALKADIKDVFPEIKESFEDAKIVN